MVRRRAALFCAIAALPLVEAAARTGEEFPWRIPAPFPRPPVPASNPMSEAKVELGRHLFHDERMSVTRTQSCASCHQQTLAFTDGLARSIGATGEVHPRGSMSLANVAYNPAFAWGDPSLTTLEAQARVPILGTHPIEMGLTGHEARFLGEVARDTTYRRLFADAHPGEAAPWTMERVVQAIAAFERTIVSMRSPYDRYRYGGDTAAISAAAKRGERFFFSGQGGGCFQCHGGWNFSGGVRYEARPDVAPAFFNTGLYNVAGPRSYPTPNTGIHAITGDAGDVGKFRAPTLRNIAVTAPYMHDGSIATLEEVLDHYAAGGRTIASGPFAGVGRENPNKAPQVHGFPMSADQRRDLIAFLATLTDSAFLSDPAYADPWRRPRR